MARGTEMLPSAAHQVEMCAEEWSSKRTAHMVRHELHDAQVRHVADGRMNRTGQAGLHARCDRRSDEAGYKRNALRTTLSTSMVILPFSHLSNRTQSIARN